MRTCFTTGSTPRSLLWALLLIGVLFGCGTTQSDPPYRVATEADQQGPFTNRLVEASSPYLLQHAHNPVDWQEWGDAAFEEARRRDVPVLLSVGYAACHWCHVMEHESFANPAIAAFLNAHFVAIKVDREERPDVDAVYMAALQRMTGHGGWPMTLFLTPDRKPFYGGTYYPPEDRSNRPGFRTVLDRVHRGWTTDRTGVLQSAEALTQDLEQATARVRAAEGLPDSPEADAVRALLAQWDPVHHGFGTSTRFPDVPAVRLLLHHGIRTDNPEVLDTVLTLLHTMERSGLHDHLAGGFHRYTVDRAWRIPHFEKMLYDNAQLLELYAEASVALDEPRFAYTASWIAAWLVADLRHRSGAFMSSLDADAAGEEGTTYVWTPDQVKAVLGHHSQPFLQAYTVSSPGNFEGASVLYRPDADPRDPALLIARQKLLQARKLREQPALDHKRVVGWNGLAISALARAGRWLDQPSFGVAAERAAKACLDGRRPDGALPRTLEEGSPLGVLDDYAYLARGLLDLYEATGDGQWLVAAQATAEQARLRFWEAGRGYHYADRAVPGLLVRQLDWTDGDKPSGAAMMLSVEQRLLALGAPDRTHSRLGADVHSAAGWLTVAPSAVPTLARVTGQHQRGAVQVVLAPAERTPEALEPFWEILDEAIRPGVVVGYAAPADETMTRPFSVLEGKTADGTRTRVYVCKDGVCDAPVDTPEALRLALERTSRRSAAAPASQAVPAPKPALQPGVQRSSRPKP